MAKSKTYKWLKKRYPNLVLYDPKTHILYTGLADILEEYNKYMNISPKRNYKINDIDELSRLY